MPLAAPASWRRFSPEPATVKIAARMAVLRPSKPNSTAKAAGLKTSHAALWIYDRRYV